MLIKVLGAKEGSHYCLGNHPGRPVSVFVLHRRSTLKLYKVSKYEDTSGDRRFCIIAFEE
jgi:hypothetical protein